MNKIVVSISFSLLHELLTRYRETGYDHIRKYRPARDLPYFDIQRRISVSVAGLKVVIIMAAQVQTELTYECLFELYSFRRYIIDMRLTYLVSEYCS